MDYVDVETVCKQIGATPTTVKPDGVTPMYTVPVLYDPSTKTIISESARIAAYLDKTYPDTPQVFPPGTYGLYLAFREAVDTAILYQIFPLAVYATLRVMDERSLEYFRQSREAMFGMRLEDVAPAGTKATEEKWLEVEAGLKKIAGWFDTARLNDGQDSVFIAGGDNPTAADFLVAARLICTRVVLGPDSDGWKRITALDGGRWARFMERFKQYEDVA